MRASGAFRGIDAGNEALEQIMKRTDSDIILIVDDEASIRKSLQSVLSDEGFNVAVVEDGHHALSYLESNPASLVLLDIWMPGIDGLETLVAIKERYPSLPVVMISGHATIAAAIKATKLGASDFIEKPLDLEMTLKCVHSALGHAPLDPAQGVSEGGQAEAGEDLEIGTGPDLAEINRVAFRNHAMAGERIPQRTIAHSALLYGQGLHSGRKSGLILEPLPPNSGIHFAGVSETTVVPAHLDFVGSTGFATTIKLGETQASTIEHIMSTLHAYGICNLLIKCNGEVPVMDGSAMEFCSLIDETGVEEQDGEWYAIKIRNPIRVGSDSEFILVEPSDVFSVNYILEYPEPVGRQQLEFVFSGTETYRKEIAPARTFGFVRDIGWLQRQGLALGGRFDNFVLFGEEGAINCDLRFPDEPVRHKILDIMGDLYLLGRPIQGKITACMTGHSDNINLLRALREELQKG